MKKIKLIFIVLLLFIGIKSVNAFDTTLKIYDYAQILTPNEEESLKLEIDEFIKDYNMDMVLVSVKYHQRNTTKAYAEDFYDYNGFGLNSTYDGIIFVIDFNFGYRDIYISTTGESIRLYDDYRINNMLDNISDVSNKDYVDWYKSFISDAKYYASLGVPSSNSGTHIDNNGDLVYNDSYLIKNLPWLMIIIISLVIPSIVIVILINKNKMIKKSINANYYIKEGSIVINTRNDRFVTTHTTSVRINDSSSSSGGRVGGSSTSRGSSGRSHGGGGRRL